MSAENIANPHDYYQEVRREHPFVIDFLEQDRLHGGHWLARRGQRRLFETRPPQNGPENLPRGRT